MRLKYIVVAMIAVLLLSFLGCVPEKEEGEESLAETTTFSSAEETSATTTKSGGIFGEIQEHGTLPSVSFDDFK